MITSTDVQEIIDFVKSKHLSKDEKSQLADHFGTNSDIWVRGYNQGHYDGYNAAYNEIEE